ncbi:hypothetical protein VFPPC_16598 [Pochonia chlamydosporia 170]|uniref:DUF952 domain-containing protein n=1 Tax=Pochonia chlamydosporia 170 TaxID=1380566 RepID=A0A179F9B1_METCM|nr:hypothetical protein VFPPC_16598 [Pochonia chlamydosporia 170]OAQ62032.1 hypothetical protein VFPPC_16598 [Pochonia chlamydosporia 170]
MSAESPPKYVYKIVPTAPPEPIPQAFPLSDLDRQDGFIHLSTAQQVPLTCDRFFSSTSALWLLKFQLDQFADPIKWEDEFPHLYGNFGGKDVVSVQKFDKAEGQSWPESMSASSWLE